ncbi:MAG TPA: glutamate-5-semialdehyde dehydrogenase [Xanthomonadales bacterium]|nr:glutamate-5-semialdehyde dehydrogenase [Xanthomonadales bacterium]
MNPSTDSQQAMDLRPELLATREAARKLAAASPAAVQPVLMRLADRLEEATPALLTANRLDLQRMDLADPRYDRLLLNEERITAIAQDLRNVANLPSPVGEVLEQRSLENDLQLSKVRVPIGVVAVIFESRPNVTFDVFGLCLKTHNACVLKGSRDAHDTNLVAVQLMQEVLEENGFDPRTVYLAPPEREYLPQILQANGIIDLAIPRGSRGLIDFVRDNARIPVIETGAGIVHTYVDASADLQKAAAIVTNAKSRRVSVCNALDTLVLHRQLLPELPKLMKQLGEQFQVEVFADPDAFAALDGHYAGPLNPASEEHFGQEFLSLRMSIKTVDNLGEALEHIHRYSSKHSEAVVAEDASVIAQFLQQVDAAAVYANASTAFTDGAQFGMGAEIGISTQKLHARGPMALAELTSYKWLVRGDGQVRP